MGQHYKVVDSPGFGFLSIPMNWTRITTPLHPLGKKQGEDVESGETLPGHLVSRPWIQVDIMVDSQHSLGLPKVEIMGSLDEYETTSEGDENSKVPIATEAIKVVLMDTLENESLQAQKVGRQGSQ